MNYGELQAKIIDQSHRKDMAARVPQFIEDARVILNYRLSLDLAPFSAPEDTNDLLTGNWLLYFYPAMKALHEFILEFETASYWDAMYQEQAGAYYTTRKGQETLVITPEEPMP